MNYFEAMISDEERAKLPYLDTIPQLLKKCEEDYTDQIAVVDDLRELTYKEFCHDIGLRRTVLQEQQTAVGAHVGVMCRNNVNAMSWFMAVPSAGRVLIMLPVSLSEQALSALVSKFDIDLLVMDKEYLPLAKALNVTAIEAATKADVYTECVDVQKTTAAAIFMTGGTTGVPKGVILNHGALMRGAHNGTYRPAGTVFGNTYILMLPLCHIFGAIAGFMGCLYTGSTIYGCNDVRSGIMMIPRVKPTSLVLVPGIVEIILSLARMKGVAFLGNLHTIICGAAPVPARLMKDFKTYNIHLFAGYGLTEGTNLTCANIDIDTKPHSMGKFYPHQEVRIVDGELWIRGDNVMDGYYKDPEETKRVLEDGWLKTGDLVAIDEEGYVTITGRIKNLIILPNGENVSPEELEDLVNQSSIVRDCLVKERVVNGIPSLSIEVYPIDEVRAWNDTEKIKVAVTEEIQKINDCLPSYKKMNNIMIRTEDFKRTGAMKIDRRNS